LALLACLLTLTLSAAAAQEKPSLAEASLAAGKALFEAGNFAEALEAFRPTEGIAPATLLKGSEKSSPAWKAWYESRYYSARCYLELKDYDRAESTLRSIVGAYDDAARMVEVGQSFFKIDRLDFVIELLGAWAAAHGDYGDIHILIGWAWFLRGDYDKTVESGRKAFAFGSYAPVPFFNAAIASLVQGKLREAFVWYARALELFADGQADTKDFLESSTIGDLDAYGPTAGAQGAFANFTRWLIWKKSGNEAARLVIIGRLGSEAGLRAELEAIEKQGGLAPTAWQYLADFHAAAGDDQAALRCLAAARREWPTYCIEDFRSDPDLARLVAKGGLGGFAAPAAIIPRTDYAKLGKSGGVEIVVQQGFTEDPGIDISPDGKLLILWSAADRRVALWDRRGRLLRSVSTPSDYPLRASFSPDGLSFAYLDAGGTLRLFDVYGRLLKTTGGEGDKIENFAFSPDGKSIALRTAKGIELRDLETLKTYAIIPTNTKAKVAPFAYASNGRAILACGDDDRLRRFGLDGSIEQTYPDYGDSPSAIVPLDGLRSFALKTANDRLLVCYASDGAIRQSIRVEGGIGNFAASADGRVGFLGAQSGLFAIDLVDFSVKASREGNFSYVPILACPDTGTALFVASNRVCEWDPSTGAYAEKGSMGKSPGEMGSFDVADSGKLIAAASEREFHAWQADGSLAFSRAWDDAKDGRRESTSLVFERGKDSLTGSYAVFGDESPPVVATYPLSLDLPSRSLERGLEAPFPIRLEPHSLNRDRRLALASGIVYNLGSRSVASALDVGEGVKKFTFQPRNVSDISFILKYFRDMEDDWWPNESLSPDGRLAISGRGYLDAFVFDVASGKRRFTLSGHESTILRTAFNPDGKLIATCGMDYTARLWSSEMGACLGVLTGHKGWVRCLDFSPDGSALATGSDDGAIMIWSTASLKAQRVLAVRSGAVEDLLYGADGKHLYSRSTDGVVTIWNLADPDQVTNNMSLYAVGDQWIMYTPDGYFDCSARGQDLVAAVRDLEVYSINQFAARNNRPDIILGRIGLVDAALVSHFREQFLKRLRRLGLTEATLAFDFAAIPRSVLAASSKAGRELVLDIGLDGAGADLRSWNLWVNEVPLFGAAGKAATGRKLSTREKIILNPGRNVIEVGCMNAMGLESFREPLEVAWEGVVEPRLYYLGFGVSTYADPKLDLRWADKDALDLAKLFAGLEGKGYSAVIARTWTNAEVSPASIAAAKAVLATARPEDSVILFISGHGLHDVDKESTYYYLTSGAAVGNLSGTAARFELVEGILQGIAPRSKLFLMDTCESGEAEDSGSVALSLAQRDRWIYNDLVRRSGAVVFSSCRGDEASYEFDDLQNGAFTAAIKDCLAGKAADSDGDGAISSLELRAYVGRRVAELVEARTGSELQHPTVDRDNLEQIVALPAPR
jgi:WD40 repeat protein/tetratricopeptide (TPR) repeat protein